MRKERKNGGGIARSAREKMSTVKQNKEIRAAVLRAAGTNCDYETSHALTLAGARPISIHVREILDGSKSLSDCQLLVIPGGFSYGDDLGAGKLLANEVRYMVGEEMVKFAREGKPILGICNGFQVLVKSGLLTEYTEGDSWQQEMSLVPNDSARFECRWVYLKPHEDSPCIFTRGLSGPVAMPVAHGEGKVVFRSEQVKQKIVDKKLVAFSYVDEDGQPGDYPVNPNGSVMNVAGICDPTGRIMGLMPHPERHVSRWQHPAWTRDAWSATGAGLLLFQNAVVLCKEKL